ncbi:MAG: HEPN domain-containing protein [Thermoleophilia bacterium]
MTRRKTRNVQRTDAKPYLAKAEQFLSTMEQAIQEKQWDSAGLQAVHSVISASDALLAFYGGVRSTEPDHRQIAGLLQDILGKEAAPAIRHISRVIAKKNMVEYEQRRLTEKEACEMAEHARRFFTWAKGMLP